jgi:2-methylcitrate dehydratase
MMCQPFESAALSLVKENDIKPEEVESIVAYCGTKAYAIAAAPEKRIPQNGIHAQFSTYYKIASAVARRQSTFAEYTDQAVRDSTVIDLCRKIEIRSSPEYDEGLAQGKSGSLEIKTKRRQGTFSASAGTFKGHPDNPMSWEDLDHKMKGCAPLSAKPVSEKNLTELKETIKSLEDVGDCSRIVKLIVGGYRK